MSRKRYLLSGIRIGDIQVSTLPGSPFRPFVVSLAEVSSHSLVAYGRVLCFGFCRRFAIKDLSVLKIGKWCLQLKCESDARMPKIWLYAVSSKELYSLSDDIMTAKNCSCPECGREATTKNVRVGKGNLLRLAIALLLIMACGNVSAIVCKRFRDFRAVLDDDAYEAFVAMVWYVPGWMRTEVPQEGVMPAMSNAFPKAERA